MKLSPITYFAIGFALFLVAIGFGLRVFIPNNTEAGYYRTYRDQLQAEADKQPQADRRLRDAEAMVEEKAAQWRQVVATRTPPESVQAGGIDISQNAWQLTVDSRKFRDNIQRDLNFQLRRGGVRVLTAPEIPFPDDSASSILQSFYNYPSIKFPVVIFNLGTVTVQGTYRQIRDHVLSFSRMPRYLAVTDGLRLEGTSPLLTASYNLTLIGYIRGTEVFPPVPEGAATASLGGGPGGPPAGFRPPGAPGGAPFGGPGGPPPGFGGPPAGFSGGRPPGAGQ